MISLASLGIDLQNDTEFGHGNGSKVTPNFFSDGNIRPDDVSGVVYAEIEMINM